MSEYLHAGTIDSAAATPPRAPAHTRRRSFVRLVIQILVAGFFIAPLALGAPFGFFLLSPNQSRGEQTFEVRPGESLREIAEALESKNLVRKSWAFRILVIVQGRAGEIKAGEFTLSPSLSAFRVSEILTAQAPPERDVKITIPEGFTVEEIDMRLAHAGLVSGPGAFKNALLEDCDLLAEEVPCATPIEDLEGYLFPDTYRFSKRQTPQQIALIMIANFEEKALSQWRHETPARKKPLGEIVSMASLIEEEVRSDADRALVSGVLWKRLSIGMALQVDATVLYAKYGGKTLTKEERRVTLEDLATDSPYNTYKYTGLPPGPISNPGLSSFITAMRPEASEYFYYLSAPDGATIFSRTLDEHNRAKAQYLR